MILVRTSGIRQLYLVLHFLHVIVNLTEARYLKTDENQSYSLQTSNALDEDVDLETVVEDYYDDLWQYLEMVAARGTEDKSNKKLKEMENKQSTKKPTFPDYDYMSDMAADVHPTADETVNYNKATSAADQAKADEKANPTHANGQVLNGSHGGYEISSVLRANRESNSEEEFAQRSKEMRLKSIISQVLSFRGGSQKSNDQIPNVKHFNALREIYEKNKKRIKTDDWTASYTEKVQSFYPSCDVPRNTDEDVWSDPYSMNLLFDLDYPNPQEDSTIMIVSAKLRLYKLPQENFSAPAVESTSPKIKTEGKYPGNLGILPGDDDRQIRVSVYWYTRSLRRHRAKKKLLDSQMLTVFRPKWAEFNIRAAVRTWKDSGKNFGLVVTVEDEDGNLLPAEQYIHSMNCSKWTATVRPIPSIIMDKAHQYYVENLMENKNETVEDGGGRSEDEKSKIYSYEPLLYPIIDLRTREVPNSELKNLALVNSAKIALESKFLNISRREVNINSSSSSSSSGLTAFLKNYNQHGGGESTGKRPFGDFQTFPLTSTANSNQPNLFRSLKKNKRPEERTEGAGLFQNVPIGFPINTSQHRNHFKKNQGSEEGSEGDRTGEREREMPKIRHGRRQMHQKSVGSSL